MNTVKISTELFLFDILSLGLKIFPMKLMCIQDFFRKGPMMWLKVLLWFDSLSRNIRIALVWQTFLHVRHCTAVLCQLRRKHRNALVWHSPEKYYTAASESPENIIILRLSWNYCYLAVLKKCDQLLATYFASCASYFFLFSKTFANSMGKKIGQEIMQ